MLSNKDVHFKHLNTTDNIHNIKMMKSALISVSDKNNIDVMASFLVENNFHIFSTGGTYKSLSRSIDSAKLHQVSDLTKFPEILNGRVKTLHPTIYGGLLAKRDNSEHIEELNEHNIPTIDVVIVNLYPFNKVIENEQSNMIMDEALELIDIGGVTLLRAAAKSFKDVLVISDSTDYEYIINNFNNLSFHDRQNMAYKAFNHTMKYDTMISEYLNNDENPNNKPNKIIRSYTHQTNLKYGCNPHQSVGNLYSLNDNFPFSILNGELGYINSLDALNAFQLVTELKLSINVPCATSFKHTSPAGVGTSTPLSDVLKSVYNVQNDVLTPLAVAYVRARNADPMSSFGDFIALSDVVDKETAVIIKREVSDGIIAPGYTDDAFKILSQKKKGKYVILQGDINYKNLSSTEFREIYGVGIEQSTNNVRFTKDMMKNIVTQNKNITDNIVQDLVMTNTALKFSQSNNVAFSYNGQIIGLGAGQQSRVDCVKLAKRKAETWFLRQHPKSIELFSLFKSTVKRQDKVNAIVRYVEGDFTELEYNEWKNLFEKIPDPLLPEEKIEFLKQVDNVCLASDAFFPFRDNIDHSSKIGTRFILQPGGSVADESIIKACNDYNMCMILSGIRVFTH